MAKIVLNTVKNGNTLSTINSNFSAIASELQNKVLYRNNPVGEPNAVITDIDVNGQDLLNVATVFADELVLDGLNVGDAVAAAATSAANAAASATASANSATASDASADAAAVSAAEAAASAASIADGPVFSYNGRFGVVVSTPADKAGLALVKADVGLGNVDNTSDATKFTNTALTGVPTAPTAAPGTSTTQLATTAFVTSVDVLKAPLASPALTGVPTAPTASSATNNTQIATTAFVHSLVDVPTMSAYRSGSQALTSGVLAAVVFNTLEWDTHSYFNTSNGRYTPLVAGYYQVNSSVSLVFTGGNSNNVQIHLQKNGSTFKRGTVLVEQPLDFQIVQIPGSCVMFMNGTTDFISIGITAFFGSTGNINGSSSIESWLDITLLRPA